MYWCTCTRLVDLFYFCRLSHVEVERLVAVLLRVSEAAALPCRSLSSHQGTTVHSCWNAEQAMQPQWLWWWVMIMVRVCVRACACVNVCFWMIVHRCSYISIKMDSQNSSTFQYNVNTSVFHQLYAHECVCVTLYMLILSRNYSISFFSPVCRLWSPIRVLRLWCALREAVCTAGSGRSVFRCQGVHTWLLLPTGDYFH